MRVDSYSRPLKPTVIVGREHGLRSVVQKGEGQSTYGSNGLCNQEVSER